jgi:hypothetical protein
MVDEETPTYLGCGMDFNSCQETTNMRKETTEEEELMPPEKMSYAVKPQGVQSRIAKDDF